VAEEIPVPQVVKEKTYAGKVAFPVAIPHDLVQYLSFPDDLFQSAKELGLSDHAMKFLMAALHGKWAVTAAVNLQDIAIKTGLQYSEMDAIVRDLIEKNYARLHDRLDLYRLWIVLLHIRGIRFIPGEA
jgi:hypothetical protein